MIEKAIAITNTADIFVVAGTSLMVYPAAGLIDMAPSQSLKFVIDKNIPPLKSMPDLVTIEKPATEGVKELIALLKALL